MSLDAAIAQLVTTVGDIEGIKFAPDDPPEASAVYPFAIVYPSTGEYESLTAMKFKEIHTIILEVYFNRAWLPEAVKTMKPFITLVANVLRDDPTLNSTVSTIISEANNKINYAVLFAEYAGDDVLILQFRIPVKIQE